jgi:hypothetical protein
VRLQQEIQSISTDGIPVTRAQISKMTYLKNILNESKSAGRTDFQHDTKTCPSSKQTLRYRPRQCANGNEDHGSSEGRRSRWPIPGPHPERHGDWVFAIPHASRPRYIRRRRQRVPPREMGGRQNEEHRTGLYALSRRTQNLLGK